MSLLTRFRHNLTARIGTVFLLLLLVSTVAGVFLVRHYVARDLDDGVRREMMIGLARMESNLRKHQDQVLLFAKIASRAAQLQDPVGSTTLQISAVEESRAAGIEIEQPVEWKPGAKQWGALQRGFAGIPSVDIAIRGEGPSRVHIVAVAPVEEPSGKRRVIVADKPLGREFLRREKEALGGDVSLLLRDELIVSSSTCIECMNCLLEVLADEGHWKALEAGRPIYYTFDCDPEPQAAILSPVRTFEGKTVAMVLFRSRENEVRALGHATLATMGGGLAFTLAMSGIFLLMTSRAILPLKELTRIATGISEGRYGETIPVHGEGEVSDLAAAFNRMSLSLQEASREISDWNRTLEKRVEEKTQELERVHRRMVEVEKLAAIGQLAAGVAHELNNPLSGIMGYSEVALEIYRERPPGEISADDMKKMVAYFGHISTLTQRCRSIIIDMLTFARQHKEEPREVRLNDLVEETLLFLGKQMLRRKVSVVRDLGGELPAIQANPGQLQQVFTNIVLNAAQAMPDGGTLTVRTRRAGDTLEAEFRDTGTGIDGESLKRIFEPFFTTKPVGEGTGLGLSVSYGIVQRHGGDIRVASERGKGATFTVVLPLDGAAG